MQQQELDAIYINLQGLYVQEAVTKSKLKELEGKTFPTETEQTEQDRIQVALHNQLKEQLNEKLSACTHGIKSTLVALMIR